MKEKNLVRIALIASLSVTTGCAAAAVSAESLNGQESQAVAVETTQPDYTDAAVLAAAMHATAVSVQNEGTTGLIEDGFTPESLSSQKLVTGTWSFDVNIAGAPSVGSTSSKCDSTIINVPELNAFVDMGVWHCFASEKIEPEIEEIMRQSNPGVAVNVTNTSLAAIEIDGIRLDRNQFGMALYKDESFNWNGPDGVSLLFISKDSLSEQDRARLENDAITLDQLWLEDIPQDASFFEICTPDDTALIPVVMENGTFDNRQVQTNNTLYAEPLLSGMGCSGAAVDAKINGKMYVAAVHAGARHGDPIMPETVVAYKLAGMGRQNLLQKLTEAQADLISRAQR